MCKHLSLLIIIILAFICLTSAAAMGYYICGDANGDQDVNVSDAVHIINYVFVGGAVPSPLEVADCNCDTDVNVSDAVMIINYVFVGGNEPCDTDGDGIPDCDPSCPCTVTDIDGNVYQTVKIGDQCWMTENLKVTHYRNGDSIPYVTNVVEWGSLSTGAYCEYNNDSANVAIYGRLFNWYAIIDGRNIAPDGWHVPSDTEWKVLEMHLGMSQAEADAEGWRGTDEGGKLKEVGTTHWSLPNTGATNESGFTALPGGYRIDYGNFQNMGSRAYFWSCTQGFNSGAWDRSLDYSSSKVQRISENDRKGGFSVRCVKGEMGALGTAVIDPSPDSINAPWSLTGPAGHITIGNGDASYTYLIPGDYTLNWGYIWDWIKPPDSTLYLADGDTVTFVGTYIEGVWPDSTVTDIDGNVYQTIKIGDQWWMAENLKVTHYRNGDPIPNVTNAVEWASLSTGAYCEYNNDSANVATYGRLYNWYAINDGRCIAPEGWHVPSDAELKELEMYLGMSHAEADATNWRGTDEGGKLKEAGTAHWNPPNTGATNISGFTALPTGTRYSDGNFGGIAIVTDFWSSTEFSLNAVSRLLYHQYSQVGRYYANKLRGHSVRCVRDD